jgi:hypothetical protein
MLPILRREQKRERDCYSLKASAIAFQKQKTCQPSSKNYYNLTTQKKRPDFNSER